jgi:hypothetical protein
MVEIISIITLALLVIAQAVERYLFGKYMAEELSKSMKAVMSRNINEFLAATQPDKKDTTDFRQNDEVDIDQASDEEFDKAIKS